MNTNQDVIKDWIPKEGSHFIPDFLQKRVDGFFNERVMRTWHGGHIMRGLNPGKNSILISNNDYLGLSHHPYVIKAQVDSLNQHGVGLMMSTVFLHGDNTQATFEEKMAAFLGSEDVLVTQSGWCANTGLLQSVADKNTIVYIDMFAHMSLWEGITSAGAIVKQFRHNNAEHLEKLIQQNGPGVIVVDSVYSTNGDVCPLADVVEIGHRHGCLIVVDESHSLGTHGTYGEGIVASLGLADKVQFRTASLAKAFCGRGGIIACSKRHKEYLLCESRPSIFSSAVLPHDLAGFSATLDVIKYGNDRRVKLHRNADYLRENLTALGYNVDVSKSQIVSLESGTEQQTIVLRDALEKRGIFGAIFCAPATPKNRALMRFSVNADLTYADLDRIIKACKDMRKEVNMKEWASTKRLQRFKRPTRVVALQTIVNNLQRADNIMKFPCRKI